MTPHAARPSYEMLVRGRFGASGIRVSHTPGRAAIAPDLSIRIEHEWRTRVVDAARAGVVLTNGALLRLVGYELAGEDLSLQLGDTTYAEFLGTNHVALRRESMAWEDLANPLGTSALILARDGTLVLGLRGNAVLHHQGHVHTIGGMFEAVDLVGGRVEACGSILREVSEELGVRQAEVSDIVCRGVMRDLENLQPELMFEIEVRLTFDQLEARWREAESRDEHRELVGIPDDPGAIRGYLDQGPVLAPQARAALDLRLER